MKVGRIGAIGAAAALCACGRLETPDLGTGAISGRLSGAASTASGQVYVLGAPDRAASLAADGSFTIERAPIGLRQVVLFDGGSRAEILAVSVHPGGRSILERDAADMPLAGRISAAVRPVSGALGTGARFTVLGTVHRDLAAVGEGLVIGPLPPGTFALSAALEGFRPQPVAVTVLAGLASGAEVTMDVEEEDGDHKGCLSTSCPNGLHCEPVEGRCRECVDGSHCDAGEYCDAGTHTCVEGVAGAGTFCEAAVDVSYCAEGAWVSAGGALGYCSATCAVPGDCPAGWDCREGTCAVKKSCLDLVASFGSACAHDDPCRDDLYGGTCLRADDDEPGYCTAPCASDAACAAAGFGTCKLGPRGGSFCQP